MTSTFSLIQIPRSELKEDKILSCYSKSGLNVIKRKLKYFEGRMRFPFTSSGKKISIPIGVFEKIFIKRCD